MKLPANKIEASASKSSFNGKYALGFVKVDVENKRMLATDGYIGAIVPIEPDKQDHSTLISVDTMKAIRTLEKQHKQSARITTNGKVNVEVGAASRIFEPVTGQQFPELDKVMPHFDGPATITLDVHMLSRLTAALHSTRSGVVALWIKDKTSAILVKPINGLGDEDDSHAVGVLMPVRPRAGSAAPHVPSQPKKAKPKPIPPRPGHLSKAERRRIAQAQMKRWAQHRAAQGVKVAEPPHQPPAQAWEVERGPGHLRKFATWTHRSGWVVQHCGHPTANYPWSAITPKGESPIVSPTGRAWMHLADAKAAVEALLAGAAILTKEGRIVSKSAAPAAPKPVAQASTRIITPDQWGRTYSVKQHINRDGSTSPNCWDVCKDGKRVDTARTEKKALDIVARLKFVAATKKTEAA